MLPYPNIDPIIISLGPLSLRWYSVAYLAGIAAPFFLFKSILTNTFKLIIDDCYNFATTLIIGIILGGRLGYVLFYDLAYYLDHPLKIIATWQGGMSYHGGLIGCFLATLIYAKSKKINRFALLDIVCISSTIGIGLGRLANFINGELYGRISSVPWAMVFPTGGPHPRHPSQLYEALLEGLLLGLCLWLIYKKANPKPGLISGLYLMGYSSMRFIIEFFREPDSHLGTLALRLSLGQWLCIAELLCGIAWIYYSKKHPHSTSLSTPAPLC